MQKLIDRIVERIAQLHGIAFLTLANTGDEKSDLAHNEVRAYINKAISIIREEVAAYNNGWTRVEDGLPEGNGNYIVTACDELCSDDERIWGDTVVTQAEYYNGTWVWYEGTDEYYIEDIVAAWRPLPEPYKQEDKNV